MIIGKGKKELFLSNIPKSVLSGVLISFVAKAIRLLAMLHLLMTFSCSERERGEERAGGREGEKG